MLLVRQISRSAGRIISLARPRPDSYLKPRIKHAGVFENFSHISPAAEARIRADFSLISQDGNPLETEVARLRSIANRRAEAASARFVEDVRVRKLTIANGRGTVHKVAYDLEEQFGIRLLPLAA